MLASFETWKGSCLRSGATRDLVMSLNENVAQRKSEKEDETLGKEKDKIFDRSVIVSADDGAARKLRVALPAGVEVACVGRFLLRVECSEERMGDVENALNGMRLRWGEE